MVGDHVEESGSSTSAAACVAFSVRDWCRECVLRPLSTPACHSMPLSLPHHPLHVQMDKWGREWMNAESPVRAHRLLTLSLSAHDVRGNVLGRRLWFFIAAAGQTYLLTISKWSCHMSTIWNAPHMLKWHMNQMHGAAHQSTTFIYMAWSPILMYAQLKQLNLGHGNALLSSALSTCMVLGRSSGQDCHSHSCMTGSWTGLDCFVQQHVAMNETLCCLTYFLLTELKILLFRSWCQDKNL